MRMWNTGYVEPEKQTGGNSNVHFGLNQGAFVTKFEFNPNGGKDGEARDSFDVTVNVNGNEFKQRFFPPEKVFVGGEELPKNHPDYQKNLEKQIEMLSATLIHIAEALAGKDYIKQAMSRPFPDFKTWAQTLERAVKTANPNWDKTPVDVFLQYQWQPTGENTRTFLELPKNIKQGLYIVKAQEGNFEKDETSSGIKYVNENGEVHPLKRNKWFAESNFANPINLEEVTNTAWETPKVDNGESSNPF